MADWLKDPGVCFTLTAVVPEESSSGKVLVVFDTLAVESCGSKV